MIGSGRMSGPPLVQASIDDFSDRYDPSTAIGSTFDMNDNVDRRPELRTNRLKRQPVAAHDCQPLEPTKGIDR